MLSKNRILFNIFSLVGFSIISLGILAFSSSRESKKLEVGIEAEINALPLHSNEFHLALRDSIEEFGMELIGTPYVYGACSREAFDCSGFVYYVFQHFDIEVPRSSSQFEYFGEEVSIDHVKKGDILIFQSPTRDAVGHVGIVTKADGMESDFVHASSGKEMKVMISSLNHPGYNRRFVKAINVL